MLAACPRCQEDLAVWAEEQSGDVSVEPPVPTEAAAGRREGFLLTVPSPRVHLRREESGRAWRGVETFDLRVCPPGKVSAG